jgi:hypothetical protein
MLSIEMTVEKFIFASKFQKRSQPNRKRIYWLTHVKLKPNSEENFMSFRTQKPE